jgi:TolB-like protein/predicted Zn-dependent protease
VLPFENGSGDPAQDGVAAGITRDVIDQLARSSENRLVADEAALIPAATSALYRGKTIDLHKIGRDHKVHFALAGNARHQDGRLIVSAALYETDNDRPIWSQQFDRADSSDQRKSIVEHITDGLGQAAIDAEVARAMREHPNSLDKRDLYLEAEASSLYASTKKNYLAALALLDRALALDPDYVPALAKKAQYRAQFVHDGFSSDPDADLDIAIKAADRALLVAPNDVNVLRRKARVLDTQGKFDEAAALIRRVLEVDPLDGWRFLELGQIQMIQGRFKEALENLVTAKQLVAETSPHIDQNLANALLANDRFPEAIAEAQLAIGEYPPEGGFSAELPWLTVIAAESENGQAAEARADLQKFLATPRILRSIAKVQKVRHYAANPKLLEGLRQAGMPAE